jgi:hypothetical protein
MNTDIDPEIDKKCPAPSMFGDWGGVLRLYSVGRPTPMVSDAIFYRFVYTFPVFCKNCSTQAAVCRDASRARLTASVTWPEAVPP